MMSLILSIGVAPGVETIKSCATAMASCRAALARSRCSKCGAFDGRCNLCGRAPDAGHERGMLPVGICAADWREEEDTIMKCSEIINRNVEWLTETDSVLKAASVMAEAGVGFLPICDARQRVIGVVTDRDLATRALAQNVKPETTSAAMVMSAPAVTCLA